MILRKSQLNQYYRYHQRCGASKKELVRERKAKGFRREGAVVVFIRIRTLFPLPPPCGKAEEPAIPFLSGLLLTLPEIRRSKLSREHTFDIYRL
jgi:hypothetical protein